VEVNSEESSELPDIDGTALHPVERKRKRSGDDLSSEDKVEEEVAEKKSRINSKLALFSRSKVDED
jgi:hypothetical protein